MKTCTVRSAFAPFAIEPNAMRVGERDLAKADLVAGAQLGRDRKIDRDHVRNCWITADGVAISEQQNGLASRRNLNPSRHDCFGDKIDIVLSFQFRSVETNAHAVGIRRHGECFCCDALKG